MEKKRILVVDDEEDLVTVLKTRLSNAGYEVLENYDGRSALATAEKARPDLILLDVILPDINGMELKNRLNNNEATAHIPVIFLTAMGEVESKLEGLRLGADDYITKPFNSEELLARIRAALDRRDFYERISMIDGLTGLPNVTYFNKQFNLFFSIAKRYGKTFSLAIMDIDNFKSINDTYGHVAGDFVLKEFALIAKKCFRSSDTVARYGGDEFTVIMPETNKEQAAVSIKRLKETILKAGLLQYNHTIQIAYSVSAGVTSYEERFQNSTEMFELADKMLYADKNKK